MSQSKQTTDHLTIQQWVEQRDGIPTVVEGTESGQGEGVLRIHFPEASDDQNFKEVPWDDFFEAFEKNSLAFLYQDTSDSTFHKFVSRED